MRPHRTLIGLIVFAVASSGCGTRNDDDQGTVVGRQIGERVVERMRAGARSRLMASR